MVILGLTGSIGMGKSTAVQCLRRLRVPVYDADAAVHEVFAKGGAAVAPVGEAFPSVIVDGAVDRSALSRLAVDNPAVLERLEAIVHPIVRRLQDRFLRAMAIRRADLVVLDIPLLFETGGEHRCDAVVVVTAPAYLQRQRVLARPGMTEEKFELIRARQTPDAAKRRRADFIVPSNRNKRATLLALRAIVETMRVAPARCWPYNAATAPRRLTPPDLSLPASSRPS
jgi:dephospho-CoA kinase